ncbi:hypothetical protein F511_44534 [Dorcoceras hygrometricum]|uniref:Uncharacterized protein n=1 Tax=Dorcoceras hygrometricum TaxID=472368 RepID=A0A2Z6ZXX4_9LAMI|nr:hypothetical protein F511_44534 [Dorcoceras hygrometricum]
MGLKGKGIDQLNLHSVQLGYLMILQMGNTDPRHKSRKTKYEGYIDPSIHNPNPSLGFEGVYSSSTVILILPGDPFVVITYNIS